MLISSLQNTIIKRVAKLRLKKYRDRNRAFIVEGYYPVMFALQNNYPLNTLFVCSSLFRDKFNNEKLLAHAKEKIPSIIEVTKNVFSKISCSESHEGLLATASKKNKYLGDHKLKAHSLYLVLESIEKPSNLGALFRLSDNTAACGVIVCDDRADIYNPQAIRSSMGTFFSIDILLASRKEAISWCKTNKIKILATTPNTSTGYTKVNMKGPLAVVMGTEYAGLSSDWLSSADVKVTIPMYGQANSLSVSSSAAVILYEALKQRGVHTLAFHGSSVAKSANSRKK